MMAASGKPIVYKTYEDGYIVRQMMPDDAPTVQHWFTQYVGISRFDLEVTLASYPPNCQGFYIGEYNGERVASAIRIPWGDVFYGSCYYVEEKYRGKGFGTRLRDQVAREYVGKNILCIDAMMGSVTEKNISKFDYVADYKTGHYSMVSKKNVVQYSGEIKKATDVPFEDLIAYDNKNFISQNNQERREFLKRWIQVENGASFVALDKSGQIVGLACRRPCIQEKMHNIGPLYADNLEIGNGLMQRMADNIVGHKLEINICYTNPDALAMMKQFGFHNTMDFQRMYLNGNPGTPKNTVFGVTSVDTCGY